MSDKQQNLQDTFLNAVRKSKSAVTIFLVNGVKLQGNITWFDNFCVLLRRDGQSQLEERQPLDVADRPADLDEDEVELVVVGEDEPRGGGRPGGVGLAGGAEGIGAPRRGAAGRRGAPGRGRRPDRSHPSGCGDR